MKKCPICKKDIDTRGSFCDNCGADISTIQTGSAPNPMTGQYMTGQTAPGQPEEQGFIQKRPAARKQNKNSRFIFFMVFMGIYYLTDGFANWNF